MVSIGPLTQTGFVTILERGGFQAHGKDPSVESPPNFTMISIELDKTVLPTIDFKQLLNKHYTGVDPK